VVYGVVTLIEGRAGEQVHALWERLRSELGPQAIAEMTTPHMTYHVADSYDLARVRSLFERIAEERRTFEVGTPGIGLISRIGGGVTFLNVSRTPELDELHGHLWDPCCTASEGQVYDRYRAATWMPHVTLSYAPEVQDAAGLLVEAMRAEALPRSVPIDNLAIIEDTGEGHRLTLRVPLRAGDAETE
jgi:2'-5' RNA ligase